MTIQQATPAHFDEICAVYAAARQFMAENGNPTQWQGNYPPAEVIRQDIAAGNSYICLEAGTLCAVFMTAVGPDACYNEIDGAWQNDAPYSVIHRVASNGRVRGVLAACIAFCKENARQNGIRNLRIDTHADNHPMQHLLAKHGFVASDRVHLAGIGERLAYHLVF